jgi:hypothetical protein
MHHSGDVFKSYFREVNYLEDDLNDNLSHYSMAIERQRINCGDIGNYIKEMKAKLHESQLFKYSSYVNNE